MNPILLTCIWILSGAVTAALAVKILAKNKPGWFTLVLITVTWPVALVVYLCDWYKTATIYRWMDRCDMMRPTLKMVAASYFSRQNKDLTFPEYVENDSYAIRLLINDCLVPALEIFQLGNSPDDWERAFHYCIRTKRH